MELDISLLCSGFFFFSLSIHIKEGVNTVGFQGKANSERKKIVFIGTVREQPDGSHLHCQASFPSSQTELHAANPIGSAHLLLPMCFHSSPKLKCPPLSTLCLSPNAHILGLCSRHSIYLTCPQPSSYPLEVSLVWISPLA